MLPYYMIHFDKVRNISVAKTGSANFLHCKYDQTCDVEHGHSLSRLKEILVNEQNALIITGIRNPIDRNLSYFFQTCQDDFYNDVKTVHNNYKGEYCYVPEMVQCTSPLDAIDLYFKQENHDTLNQWFDEFLHITKIKEFDQEKGVSFYTLSNNNTLLVYTLEKLEKNYEFICDMLGIKDLKNRNMRINDLYKSVKNTIIYTRDYLNKQLDTPIMRLFYGENQIKEMYDKYRTYD